MVTAECEHYTKSQMPVSGGRTIGRQKLKRKEPVEFRAKTVEAVGIAADERVTLDRSLFRILGRSEARRPEGSLGFSRRRATLWSRPAVTG